MKIRNVKSYSLIDESHVLGLEKKFKGEEGKEEFTPSTNPAYEVLRMGMCGLLPSCCITLSS